MGVVTLNDWLNEEGKQIENIIAETMFRTRCCIPAIVQKYNSSNNTVECQPAIREKLTLDDGVERYVQIPILINVPVVFPGSSSYGIKFPIRQGDEVLVVFSDLSIDNFWENGGVQNPVESRRHDLSDGIAIPCNLSLKKTTSSVSELTLYQGGQRITFSQLYSIVNSHVHTYISPGGEPAITSGPINGG